jgi:YtxH-like protein
MKLQNLRNMDKEDFLGLLNLCTKPSTGARIAEVCGLIGVGIAVGAAAALLLAPKPGSELRQDLRSRIRFPNTGIRANGRNAPVDEDEIENATPAL